jgi:hypothetical protein
MLSEAKHFAAVRWCRDRDDELVILSIQMQEVTTRQELIVEIQTMLDELREIGDDYDREGAYFNSINGWYNLTLWDFLEAMQAALIGSSASDWPAADNPQVWKAISHCLAAGKGYE